MRPLGLLIITRHCSCSQFGQWHVNLYFAAGSERDVNLT
jgi:hypothetical protein